MGSASCEGTGISESSFSSRTSLMFELLRIYQLSKNGDT